MKAIRFHYPGPPSVLQLEECAIPEPKPTEILIKVHAAGVNRPDVLQRQGKYPAPPGAVQDIPGLEVAGIIKAVGEEVDQWSVGEEVCALVTGGGYAEYVCADAGSCLPIPTGMTLTESAALPEVLFTVWHNVFQRGKLTQNEDVLIYGGSGGIGSMAIQLVNLWNANAYTMASNDKKANFCLELGAKEVLNYKDKDVLEVFGENKFDLILDSLGGDYFSKNLIMLKPEGRLIYINAMEGAKQEINLFQLMQKRLHISGSTLRARNNTFKESLRDDILNKAYPLIESQNFIPLVKQQFPLKEAVKAHSLMESRDFMGKIILTI